MLLKKRRKFLKLCLFTEVNICKLTQNKKKNKQSEKSLYYNKTKLLEICENKGKNMISN